MTNLNDKTIMIVEDNVANLAVFNVVLRNSGARILQDFWNTDTVNLLQRFPSVDIILLDLMLHNGISGYDIFDKIKGFPQLGHIPIILVTAADPGIEMPKAKLKGFNGFIGKPIDALLFPQQIADCINGIPVWYSQSFTLESKAWNTTH
jgi:CheY-like chemotaxis protein